MHFGAGEQAPNPPNYQATHCSADVANPANDAAVSAVAKGGHGCKLCSAGSRQNTSKQSSPSTHTKRGLHRLHTGHGYLSESVTLGSYHIYLHACNASTKTHRMSSSPPPSTNPYNAACTNPIHRSLHKPLQTTNPIYRGRGGRAWQYSP